MDFNNQKNKGKKIVATVLAGAVILTGGTLVAKLNTKGASNTPTTTTSTTQPKEDPYKGSGLILTDNFDINNKEQVKQRAEDIYKISDKSVSVNDIIDLIYFFNGKYELLSFKDVTDKEKKFKLIQDLDNKLAKLLSMNLSDDERALIAIVGEGEIELKEDSEIYAYMFMSGQTEKQKTDKDAAIKLAMIINTQLNDIEQGNEENFETNKEMFYDMIVNINNSDTLSDHAIVLLVYEKGAKRTVFTGFTKEQIEELNKNTHNPALNRICFAAVKEVDAYMEASNGGKVTTRKTGESYVASDKKDAEKYINTDKNDSTTKIVDKGGKPVTTSKQVIVKPGTTKVEEHTFIVKPEVTTGKYTEVITGGEVVEEFYEEDAKDADKYVDADVQTTIILEQGGAPVK